MDENLIEKFAEGRHPSRELRHGVKVLDTARFAGVHRILDSSDFSDHGEIPSRILYSDFTFVNAVISFRISSKMYARSAFAVAFYFLQSLYI